MGDDREHWTAAGAVLESRAYFESHRARSKSTISSTLIRRCSGRGQGTAASNCALAARDGLRCWPRRRLGFCWTNDQGQGGTVLGAGIVS
jgi:hypothetical protein